MRRVRGPYGGDVVEVDIYATGTSKEAPPEYTEISGYGRAGMGVGGAADVDW